jgi:hypothetical protein
MSITSIARNFAYAYCLVTDQLITLGCEGQRHGG